MKNLKKNLKKIPRQEVASLWQYYFDDNAPHSAKAQAEHVDVAVFGDADKPLLRHAKSGYTDRVYADKLLTTGRFFTGLVLDFMQMFKVRATSFTLDMEDGKTMYIVPFSTGSVQDREDDGTIDSVVVLFGSDVSVLAFQFETLSHEGWAGVEPYLRKE